jgi:hypothetical protein
MSWMVMALVCSCARTGRPPDRGPGSARDDGSPPASKEPARRSKPRGWGISVTKSGIHLRVVTGQERHILTRQIDPICAAQLVSPEEAAALKNGRRAGCDASSTTHRNRYRPDGPTLRASTMRCLVAPTFASSGGSARQTLSDPTYLIAATGVSAAPGAAMRAGQGWMFSRSSSRLG